MTAMLINGLWDDTLTQARLALRSPDELSFSEMDQHIMTLECSRDPHDQFVADQMRQVLGHRAIEAVNDELQRLYGRPAPRRITLDKVIEWAAFGFLIFAVALFAGVQIGRFWMGGI